MESSESALNPQILPAKVEAPRQLPKKPTKSFLLKRTQLYTCFTNATHLSSYCPTTDGPSRDGSERRHPSSELNKGTGGKGRTR